MKILKISSLLIAVLAITISIASCTGGGNNTQSHEEMEMNGTDHMQTDQAHGPQTAGESDNSYACPMHPEITGKEGDKCSKCGMNLELVENEKEDHGDHSHE